MKTLISARYSEPHRHRPSFRARGQALIFGLIFTAVSALVVLMLFNSSLLTTTKSQLQNAADAGAYSAALLQARDANFSAYTNRAMIANQVAVAQFVSLKSYLEDADKTHTRANDVLHSAYRFVASSAPFWDAAKKVPVDSAKSAMDSLAPGAVKALDLLIEAMDFAQDAYHGTTMADMMFVANEVVKKNDPQASVTTSIFMAGNLPVQIKKWNDSTTRFSANDSSKEADRFADAVVSRDSTDWFVRNRVSVPNVWWASTIKPYICPFSSATAYSFLHFGGTILSSNKRRWLALDATQGGGFATCFVPCPPFGTCPITVPFLDLAWSLPPTGGHGGAVAGSGGRYGESMGYKNNPFETKLYGGALISPAAIPANYRYWIAGPGSTLDSKGGIQDHYRDVSDPLNASKKPKNQTPEENGGQFPITIEVERTSGTIRDTSKFMTGSKQLALAMGNKGDTMRALSSAHAYFYRPLLDNAKLFARGGWQRSDKKTEYQNLFSPYWQARLTATPILQEVSAGTTQ